MTVKDILKRSWHNIGRAKVRVGLTAAALAVGATTMTLALAITQGAQDQIKKSFGDFKNTYVSVDGYEISNEKANDNGLQSTKDAREARFDAQTKKLTDEQVTQFKSMNGVEQIIPLAYFSFDSVIINGNDYKAPTTQPLSALVPLKELVAGKREDLKGDTAIVPERYIKEAGFKSAQEAIGQKLTFLKEARRAYLMFPAVPELRQDLTIVGVTKSAGKESSFTTEQIYMSPEKISALALKRNSQESGKAEEASYDQILLITDEKKTESIKNQLRTDGFKVVTREESLVEAVKVIDGIRIILLVFAGIAIFTAIFGVINTQLMSVLERTREIGLMKALGLSKGGILLMFSIEAGWIGFIGSVAGTLLALPLSWLISASANNAVSAPITIPNFLLVVTVLVIIAMLSGFLPARRAAKLDPVEALRSE